MNFHTQEVIHDHRTKEDPELDEFHGFQPRNM